MNGANIKTLIKAAMLPCIAAATFAAAPAQAIPVASGSPAATSLTSNTTAAATTGLTKKQIKQQRKLAKKCAKLNSNKLKASARAKLTSMCQPPVAAVTVTPPTSIIAPPAGDSSPATTTGSSNADGSSLPPVVTLPLVVTLPPVVTLLPSLGNSGKTEIGNEFSAVETPGDAVTAVPEPGSLALLGAGLLGLGLARRRRAQ